MTLLPRTPRRADRAGPIPILRRSNSPASCSTARTASSCSTSRDARDFGRRVVTLYRTLVAAARRLDRRRARPRPGHGSASIEPGPPGEDLPHRRAGRVQRLIRPYLGFGAMPQPQRPHAILVRGQFESGAILVVALHASDDRWLFAASKRRRATPGSSGTSSPPS